VVVKLIDEMGSYVLRGYDIASQFDTTLAFAKTLTPPDINFLRIVKMWQRVVSLRTAEQTLTEVKGEEAGVLPDIEVAKNYPSIRLVQRAVHAAETSVKETGELVSSEQRTYINDLVKSARQLVKTFVTPQIGNRVADLRAKLEMLEPIAGGLGGGGSWHAETTLLTAWSVVVEKYEGSLKAVTQESLLAAMESTQGVLDQYKTLASSFDTDVDNDLSAKTSKTLEIAKLTKWARSFVGIIETKRNEKVPLRKAVFDETALMKAAGLAASDLPPSVGARHEMALRMKRIA
jgi:hypothetical protein